VPTGHLECRVPRRPRLCCTAISAGLRIWRTAVSIGPDSISNPAASKRHTGTSKDLPRIPAGISIAAAAARWICRRRSTGPVMLRERYSIRWDPAPDQPERSSIGADGTMKPVTAALSVAVIPSSVLTGRKPVPYTDCPRESARWRPPASACISDYCGWLCGGSSNSFDTSTRGDRNHLLRTIGRVLAQDRRM